MEEVRKEESERKLSFPLFLRFLQFVFCYSRIFFNSFFVTLNINSGKSKAWERGCINYSLGTRLYQLKYNQPYNLESVQTLPPGVSID